MVDLDSFSSLIEALPLPVLWIGEDERISASNARAAELLGQIPPNRHYITILRQPQVLDCIETVLATGKANAAKFLSSKHGRDTSYDVQAAPAAIGGEPGVLVSFLDATQLEEAGQIRRDFVANVSHELRTPLTAMSGFIETLRGAARDDTAARERFLGIMAREAERMNRLVQDLLSLSRVESAERQRPTDHVDLLDALHHATIRVSGQAEASGVSISSDAPAGPVLVTGDNDQLMQVFINLLENAVKYAASGKEVMVRITPQDYAPALRAPAVLIEVIDRGEGIDPVHLPRLTERFYRADDHRSREMGGTGLGLAIVKHIVNRHRGRLSIASAPGQGSTFTVVLPVD